MLHQRDGALAESRIEIERLQSIIRQFLRVQFGGRSERLDPGPAEAAAEP